MVQENLPHANPPQLPCTATAPPIAHPWIPIADPIAGGARATVSVSAFPTSSFKGKDLDHIIKKKKNQRPSASHGSTTYYAPTRKFPGPDDAPNGVNTLDTHVNRECRRSHRPTPQHRSHQGHFKRRFFSKHPTARSSPSLRPATTLKKKDITKEYVSETKKKNLFFLKTEQTGK